MKNTFFSLIVLTLALTACKAPPSNSNNQEAVRPPVREVAKQPTQVASESSYTQYKDGVIGNGEESVLFFHATWCPACKANNEKLNAWYGSDSFGRSVYKIDFDTATDLRSQFGVTGQDTFILIDGNGNEVDRARFPSESVLRDLLG
ncbi:MAG: thioredoxin family protein [Candidatus Peribacteraceae bacterium]|jgi:thiol-disulfide isomerase/thioredoxin|nr:thioredoxin family protein [Candidatus Peribacteraceae bacterium]